MQLLFSFDLDMRVEKTLIQTLASQLSSTLIQLLFSFDQDMRVEKTLIQTLASQLSSTLIQLLFSFDQDMRVEKTLIQTLASQLSSTLMQLLFSFDLDMRVEKTLIQTLASQLSSTLIQLLFSFDQDMRVEKTLIQTLASQLSSTLIQLLFSFDQDMRVEKTLIQTLASQLSSTLIQLLFSFDQDMRVEKTLIQTLASQLSSTLMQLLFSFDLDMRVEKTLIQTLASQLSSTLMQLLFSFDQDKRVERTLIQTLTCLLSSTRLQLSSSFDQGMRIEKLTFSKRSISGSSLVIDALNIININLSAQSRTVFSPPLSSSSGTGSFKSIYSLSEENLALTRSGQRGVIGCRSFQLLSSKGRKALPSLSKSDTSLLEKSQNRIKPVLTKSQSGRLGCSLSLQLLSSAGRQDLPGMSRNDVSLLKKSQSRIVTAMTKTQSGLLRSLSSQLLFSTGSKDIPRLSKSDTSLLRKSCSRMKPALKTSPSGFLDCSPPPQLPSDTGSKDLPRMSRSDASRTASQSHSRLSSALTRSSQSEQLGSLSSQLLSNMGNGVSIQSHPRSSISSAATRSSHASRALSMASSQSSHHTLWTVYTSPVPGSITSSHAQNVQLQRHEREYVFVRRPFLPPLAPVSSWLSAYFASQTGRARREFDDQAIQDGPSGHGSVSTQQSSDAEDGLVCQDGPDGQESLGTVLKFDSAVGQDGPSGQGNPGTQQSSDAEVGLVSQDGSGGEGNLGNQAKSESQDNGHLIRLSQDGLSDHYKLVMPTHHDVEDMLVNQRGQSSSWVSYPSYDSANQRDGSVSDYYLINTLKTEVVLSDIPPPVLGMFPARNCCSMMELQGRSKWSQPRIFTSLPNISDEFGLKNIETAFDVQSLQVNGDERENTAQSSLDSPLHGYNSSSDEKSFVCDDAMDSISVVCENVERRDQALRDAARGMSYFILVFALPYHTMRCHNIPYRIIPYIIPYHTVP